MGERPAPADLGFFMPAEWSPHEATWLAWPANAVTWPGLLDRVEESYLEIISLLARFETVRLLVDDEPTAENVRLRLAERKVPTQAVDLLQVATVDAWIRDYGPNFLVRAPQDESVREAAQSIRGINGLRLGEKGPFAGAAELADSDIAYNDWGFNAWGEKYPELVADGRIPALLEPRLRMPRFEPGMVLEGGAIDVNGAGLCLTTEQCLLNPNRNPDLTREEIEGFLKGFLGVRKILWLGEGIAGDDTDGHVDDVARFVDESTVACAVEANSNDPNFEPLQENLRRLHSMADADGRPLRIVPLPMPDAISADGERLPASYANFYIATRQVLVPVFGCQADRRALQVLSELFPDREVRGVQSEALIHGMGAVHCLTQQEPKRRSADPALPA